ncbi:MAG: type VII secretion protein EccB [Dactylosporangium sp.]|nr:type VII secretion protein EccB [Dactylosporangium sp.]NNJ59589.1 type VII secretion protein EccB [Dactylosporangium sp.]
MPSRQDQVLSYQFFMQRVISAFVSRDPDPTMTPFRRLGGASFGSIMIAIICLGAVGVYGILRPGGATSWKDGASIIQEKETGTRYIYRDDMLRPVLNYASALLAMGANAPTTQVSRNSLVAVPRGPMIGIPYAPDSVPEAKRLLGGAWALCTKPTKTESGQQVATTVLTVGEPPSGGQALDEQGLLVRDPSNDRLYLIWHDRRYEIADETIVLEALALGTTPQAAAGGAWLNALPAGEPIGTIRLPGLGKTSTAVSDAVVGQVYVVANEAGDKQYYLVNTASLVPISQLQADVLLADPVIINKAYNGRSAPQALPLSAAAATSARKATVVYENTQPPATTPTIATLAGEDPALCASYASGRAEPKVLLDADVRAVTNAARTTGQTAAGTPLADRVVVRGGHGALVAAMPSPDAPGGALHLVTDLGMRYPLASNEVPSIFGYSTKNIVKLPASLIARIPSGPSLDPAAATRSIAYP